MLSAEIKVNPLKREREREIEREIAGLLDSLKLCFSLRAEDESDFHSDWQERPSIPSIEQKANLTIPNSTELKRTELRRGGIWELKSEEHYEKRFSYLLSARLVCSALCIRLLPHFICYTYLHSRNEGQFMIISGEVAP